MKVLVTGSTGQLGGELVRVLAGEGHEIIAPDRREFDLAFPEKVGDAIRAREADWVINCAAYTQVDQAEAEPELAYRVNRDSAAGIARAVSAYGGRMLQVSTDFIFSGKQSCPYTEEDHPDPVNVYGQSKWEGERAVREILPGALILRTAWVYGSRGANFVRTILMAAASREELRVVDDQIGTPSWTADISRTIQALIRGDRHGVYHFTNEGVASWYDFACAITALGASVGFPVVARRVLPIPSADYPTQAIRPRFSVLDKQKIRTLLPAPIPHWRESLHAMLKELYQCEESS